MQVDNGQTRLQQRPVEETYQKLSQLEHILLRPDTYIGSAEKTTLPLWLWNDEDECMEHREASYVPGLYKIFDEILVNAADHRQRDPSMDTIEVFIDEENNRISVKNNGSGIPVEVHKKEGVYVPELIFGHLLTSSNYNDNEKKVVGGRNGYGAKLANIFSSEFIVETADQGSNKRYHQLFKDNMSQKKKPTIKEGLKKNEQWTRISFRPDLDRFGMSFLERDVVALMKKRVYDIAGISPGVKVFLNGKKLPIKSFKDYVGLYFRERQDVQLVHERTGQRWEVVIAPSDGQFQNVSFVNSIWTMKGGNHVNHVVDQIATRVIENLTKKNKGLKLKPFQVKNHLCVFVNCLVENPSFDSQTKENMTSKQSSFGSKCELSEDFFKKVLKNSLIENILSFAKFKQSNELKKTDGGKQRRLLGIPKLDDANYAGTRDSSKCTLILTEGDSAKSLAVSGFSVVGRDYYGVFPLRGKLLNVRDASHKQIMDNAEINALKKILGLQHNKVYDRDTIKTLRYGRVLIMTDQDHDGSHIKGLLVNFFHHFWPSLVKVPGFLAEFLTPIVKCTRKKTELTFFTIPEYVKWRTSLENNTGGWKIKYYKGLGSSTAEEARGYFSNLDRHVLEFHYSGEEDFASIDLAFSKQKVQQRKEWLSAFQEGTYFDHEQGALSYKTFVDKELILFSIADNERSIPGLMDGLKPSQRKVLFSCFKRNLKTEIKVAQLQGYTSEHTAYHHGEASLMATIIGLAQSFCGSNNINFLHPAGQFGTRLQGGKDAASPRYIFTRLSKITRLLFPMEDDAILDYLEDDGVSIEPKYYAPVIPTVLVNGAEGIGTGWSSSVPCYNPRVLIELIRKLLNETPVEDLEEPQPWFRHHRGTVRRTGPNNYEVHGEVRRSSSNKLVITELPAKTWTNPYKEWLESMTTGGGHPADSKEPPFLVDVRDGGTETEVLFTLEVSDAEMAKMEDVGIHKKLRLSSSIATSNLVLFDEKRRLRKYESAREILACFFKLRLEKYEERRLYLLKMLQEAVEILENKVRFIKMVVDGKLKVAKKKKDEIIAELKRLKFKANAEKKTKKGSGDDEEDAADVDEASSGPSESVNYDYLLSMPLWSLTLERVQKLIADRDQKVVEMSNMEKSTAKDIYRFDLDRLSEGLDALDKEDMEQKRATKAARSAATNSKSRGGSKKKTLAVNEDEDVEFAEVVSLPEVKMKAAKRTAKVAVASVNPVGDKRSAPNALPKQRLTKKMVISDSESEPSFQDDSEEEELLADVKPSEPRPKAAPAKAPAAATKPTKTTAPKSAPKPSFFRQAAPVEAAADNSDDELELTLTQRLAKKMMIAERPGPNASSKSATTAKASKPEKQADAKAKRGRKGTAPKVVKSPFGVTPEAKRTKTTAKAKATRLVKVDERSSDADEESFGALSISSDEEHDEKDPTPRKRSTRARKPTTAISEVIDVDDDEDEESGSFADEDSGSDYTDGD